MIVPVLLCVAFLTLAERQILASMQRRRGPQVSAAGGLAQPFWDGMKLGLKEPAMPSGSDGPAFVWSPLMSFVLSQVVWALLPLHPLYGLNDSAFGGVCLMALSSLAVYGVMLAGWSSNSKYAFLGCCRSVAQMVSYELPMGVVLIILAGFVRDNAGMRCLHLSAVGLSSAAHVFGLILPLWPLCLIWFVLVLAETKRAPFDLPEAEAELVAGYNVEYSSMGFALFFLAEYASMASMSAVTAIYFVATWTLPISLKLTLIFYAFVWVRNTLPRYRYDQFMLLGWKGLLPLALAKFFLSHTLLLSFCLAH